VQLANVLCKDSKDGAAPRSFAGFCAHDSGLQRVVTQILPAVLVILWQNAIMPLALYGITLFESTHTSLSALDRRILMLFYWWSALNIFFGSMIAGSIFQQIRALIEQPSRITDILGESLPTSSNFFINYLALRAFGLVPFRLVLVHGGIWRWLGKCASDWEDLVLCCCLASCLCAVACGAGSVSAPVASCLLSPLPDVCCACVSGVRCVDGWVSRNGKERLCAGAAASAA
jgi:Calcium-dependent channel, 7TM region, putative phosphate